MFERARLVDRSTHSALRELLGFTIHDLAEGVLSRLDSVATQMSAHWPDGADRPLPADEPSVSAEEIKAALTVRQATLRWDANTPVGRALSWGTHSIDSEQTHVNDPSSLFGATFAYRCPNGLLATPTAYWPDSFEAALIRLAALASDRRAACQRQFEQEGQQAFARLFRMTRHEFAGPFSLLGSLPTVFALLLDERTVMLFDVISILNSESSDMHRVLNSHGAALAELRPPARLFGPSGELRLDAGLRIVSVMVVNTAGHAVTRTVAGIGGPSLDDMAWIVRETKESPDDIFYFFEELSALSRRTVVNSFETINAFEHWRSNGKCIAREGEAWDLISIEPHRGDAEWSQAAANQVVNDALRLLRLPPMTEWDGSHRHEHWPTCSVGAFPDGPFWEVRFAAPVVAVQCFEPGTPSKHRDTLLNLASSLHWKLEQSQALRHKVAQAIGQGGLRVTLRSDAHSGWPALHLAEVARDIQEIGLAYSANLPELIQADANRVERDLATALGRGLRGMQGDEANGEFEQFVNEYVSAPPGLRSDAIQLPVRQLASRRPFDVHAAAVAVSERELARRLKSAGVAPGRFSGSEATQLESRVIVPTLREMLTEQMRVFNQAKLMEFALTQVERCLSQKWNQTQTRRHNELFPLLAYDPVETEIREENDSHRLARIATAIAEEALLLPSPRGREEVARLSWVALLGTAELLVESGIRSESNHYALVPSTTEIDSMYAIRQRTSEPHLYRMDQSAFAKARANMKVRHGVDADEPPRSGRDAQEVRTRLDHVSETLRDGLGYTVDALMLVLQVGRTWRCSAGQDLDVASKEDIVARCHEAAPDVELAYVERALDQLTLRPEDLGQEIPHWEQERRRVRLMTRPFVRTPDGKLMVMPWQCEASGRVIAGNLGQGRLIFAETAHFPALIDALDRLREWRNVSLELETEAAFLETTPWVRRNVKKPKLIGVSDAAWAGEIDCLAADEAHGIIWVADAKDVFSAFSPNTIARSIEKFNGPNQYVDKLLRKAAAVATAPLAVAKALGVDRERAWGIRPVIVTRFVEPAAFSLGQRVAFCPVSKLAEFLVQSVAERSEDGGVGEG